MVSHLIEKLPGSVGDKVPPADVIVNIIAVLNNLVVESPMAARDIVYFDGLRKLFYIKKRRDRWELLCCPSSDLGSSPALPFLPWPGGVEEGHNQSPFPRLGAGSPQTSSEWPHGHQPAPCYLFRHPTRGLPITAASSFPSGCFQLLCQQCLPPCPLWWAPAFSLPPLPTGVTS